MKVRVALAQMRCEKGDWPGNLQRTEELMSRASEEGCDLIVFPEMGLSGYCDPRRFPNAAQKLSSPYLRRFARLTEKYKIAASGGFIETNPEDAQTPFITQVLANDGRIVGVYRKVNLAEDERDLFTPGRERPVFKLPLAGGELACALAVCADTDRPDLYADFARGGARLVLHSSAPGLFTRRTDEEGWKSGYDWYKDYLAERLPGYARSNNLFVAVATQTGATVDEDFPGGSFVFGPDGACLAGTDTWEETLLVHELELPEEVP